MDMMKRENLSFTEVLERLFEDRDVPISLVYRLSDMSPQQMDAFLSRWRGQSDERRRVIARHMADICEENFVVDFSPVFLQFLSDDEPGVRLAALDGLWDTSNTAVVPPIITLMRADPELTVRAAAASALGHFVLMAEWDQLDKTVADGIVEELLDVFTRGETAEAVRRAALESLGNSADPRVPELIEDAYQAGSQEMQTSAVFAMGRSADGRWLPAIIKEMGSAAPERRAEAARAAGNVGHSDGVDTLIELLRDDWLEVQLAAILALGQIGSDQAYEALVAFRDEVDRDLLYEAIEEALDEMQWLGGELDLTLFEWDEDELTG